MNMVNLKINNVPCQAPEGSTILEAAHAVGITIPTLCARNCPADAIMGSVRNPHSIDTNKCVKCGACMDTCRFGAISKG